MKILIVGAGASGVVAAINYKRNHKNDDVLIIDQSEKALKKILATGNGKCNLGNSKIDFSKYNNPKFAESVIKGYDYQEFFKSVSLETKLIGELAYPVSESAVSVRETLLNECKKLGIKFNLEEKFLDYKFGKNIEIKTSKNIYVVDKLYLASALYSSSKFNNDGSVFEILKKHGYNTTTPKEGLSPLITKEKTKLIDGVRVKAEVTLLANNKVIHKEVGEVLFKDHGLSGIVIFNLMSIIARNSDLKYKIRIDLLPEFSRNYLENYRKSHKFSELLLAFVNPKISSYLKERFNSENEIFESLKALEFTFEKSYGFEFSQVSVGGINITEVDDNLMSKKENNIYIIGELLNIDGPCGGYNLTWAFASAIKATKK